MGWSRYLKWFLGLEGRQLSNVDVITESRTLMFLNKNLTGFDQVLLLSTLCKQVRDEAQAQSKSLASSSAVAVSEVVAALQATRI